MAHGVNNIVDDQLVSFVTVAGWVKLVEGVLQSVAKVRVEIDYHHQPVLIIEQTMHRGWVVCVVKAKPPAEIPGNSPTWDLRDFIDIKEAMKYRMAQF